MTAPYLDHDGLLLYAGDAVERLSELPGESADLAVTSPPFWGLRDYGTGEWVGGNDSGCDHLAPAKGGTRTSGDHFKTTADEARRRMQFGASCGKCDAVRVDRQIGLEETPEEWAQRLVAVFDEVRRVLRPTGVLIVECGDSYGANTQGSPPTGDETARGKLGSEVNAWSGRSQTGASNPYKQKDLLGQPFLLAFALRASGWYWRGTYIWEKPNPMPESVTDRCTTAHSYLLHFTKSDRYFWDKDAISEAVSAVQPPRRFGRKMYEQAQAEDGYSGAREVALRSGQGTERNSGNHFGRVFGGEATRNARSVWRIPTEPSGLGLCPVCRAFWTRNAPLEHCGVPVVQHFAAYPAELAEKAIRAATSERGVCPCGAPWRRIVEKGEPELAANTWSANGAADQDVPAGPSSTLKHVRASETVGWRPTCRCGGDPDLYDPDGAAWPDPLPAVVLDPFGGSGTTLLAARRLGRRGVAVELNRHYCEMTARRLAIPDAVARASETSAEPVQLVLGAREPNAGGRRWRARSSHPASGSSSGRCRRTRPRSCG